MAFLKQKFLGRSYVPEPPCRIEASTSNVVAGGVESYPANTVLVTLQDRYWGFTMRCEGGEQAKR